MFGAPFVLLVALAAAAILVDDPHCLANFPNCLLYVSSKDDLQHKKGGNIHNWHTSHVFDWSYSKKGEDNKKGNVSQKPSQSISQGLSIHKQETFIYMFGI